MEIEFFLRGDQAVVPMAGTGAGMRSIPQHVAIPHGHGPSEVSGRGGTFRYSVGRSEASLVLPIIADSCRWQVEQKGGEASLRRLPEERNRVRGQVQG
jgi:hypothetical protein